MSAPYITQGHLFWGFLCMCLTFHHPAWLVFRSNPTAEPWSHFYHHGLDKRREENTEGTTQRHDNSTEKCMQNINRNCSFWTPETSRWLLRTINDLQINPDGSIQDLGGRKQYEEELSLFYAHIVCVSSISLHLRCTLRDIWFQRLPDVSVVPDSALLRPQGFKLVLHLSSTSLSTASI